MSLLFTWDVEVDLAGLDMFAVSPDIANTSKAVYDGSHRVPQYARQEDLAGLNMLPSSLDIVTTSKAVYDGSHRVPPYACQEDAADASVRVWRRPRPRALPAPSTGIGPGHSYFYFFLGRSSAFEDEDKALMRAGGGPKPNNHLYKTELCRNWEKRGTCPYGIKCQFAHGSYELRPSLKSRFHPQICRSFAINGTCRFGAYCRFLHVSPNSWLELLPGPSNLAMAAAAAGADGEVFGLGRIGDAST